jgi:chloramphenicol 3-O phosphotransferase
VVDSRGPDAFERGELYRRRVASEVAVLNGGSSSGKSGTARRPQVVLPQPWLAVGVDMLTEAMPVPM